MNDTDEKQKQSNHFPVIALTLNTKLNLFTDIMINFQVLQSKAPNHICELQISHSSMVNARKGLPGHLYYGIVRNALEMMDFPHTVEDGDEARSKKMYSSDLAALLDFMPDDIDKVSWKGWMDDTVSLGNWECGSLTPLKRG